MALAASSWTACEDPGYPEWEWCTEAYHAWHHLSFANGGGENSSIWVYLKLQSAEDPDVIHELDTLTYLKRVPDADGMNRGCLYSDDEYWSDEHRLAQQLVEEMVDAETTFKVLKAESGVITDKPEFTNSPTKAPAKFTVTKDEKTGVIRFNVWTDRTIEGGPEDYVAPEQPEGPGYEHSGDSAKD